MKNVKFVMLAFLSCLFLISAGSSASEIRIYTLGDIDDFTYNGVGSTDDVYVEVDWYDWVSNHTWTVNNFDVFGIYQTIPFTFLYDLASDEQVVGATLTLAMRGTVSGESGGGFITRYMRPSFIELGWHPIGNTEITVCSVDLSNVCGYNLLLLDLQDGQFSATVNGDIAVDYAILTLEVVPEPITLMLFGLGGLFLRKRSN